MCIHVCTFKLIFLCCLLFPSWTSGVMCKFLVRNFTHLSLFLSKRYYEILNIMKFNELINTYDGEKTKNIVKIYSENLKSLLFLKQTYIIYCIVLFNFLKIFITDTVIVILVFSCSFV